MKFHFLCISFLSAASAFSTKKPLSPSEIVAQQRAKSGLPNPDQHPKLYSDELLEDMKDILLLLEKRVQGGPGSISTAEVESFSTMSNNIVAEMKSKEYERLNDATSPASEVSPPPPPPIESAPAEATATAIAEQEEEDEEYNPEVEGPDYDPSGGQGSMPRDTTNTYIIPGMDEMSPDEYRIALQKSIIARQDKRKASGSYGNRNTWDYLNNLSGDTGYLKKEEDKDNDKLEN